VLVGRVNLFWGLDWEAHPVFLSKKNMSLLDRVNIVIGCVDTKAGRKLIHLGLTKGNDLYTDYWLDLGNRAHSGQFVLGQTRKRSEGKRLPTIAEDIVPFADFIGGLVRKGLAGEPLPAVPKSS